MTVTRYDKGTPPRLDDNFTVDYRVATQQQLFTHQLLNPGCTVLIEGDHWNKPSNAWAWYTYPNGTSCCIKGFANITLVSTSFVRRSEIEFSQAGRVNITVPHRSELVDTWRWCRMEGAECFYESVASGSWASWQFRSSNQRPNEGILEYYEDITPHSDTSRFELPTECPGKDAPPVFEENTYPNLSKVCPSVVPVSVYTASGLLV
jgi:hypothetical protein